jgi:hypothetical protein
MTSSYPPGLPYAKFVAGRAYAEVALTDEDLDLLTKALWDLAALHSTYPRQHLDRLHALRRYLLSVQVSRVGGVAWHQAVPDPPPESTES